MEIITSGNFRSGGRIEGKKLPLSILSCVQTKKDLMFDLLFGVSFVFISPMCFISSGKELLSFALGSLLARSEKRFVMRKKKQFRALSLST